MSRHIYKIPGNIHLIMGDRNYVKSLLAIEFIFLCRTFRVANYQEYIKEAKRWKKDVLSETQWNLGAHELIAAAEFIRKIK